MQKELNAKAEKVNYGAVMRNLMKSVRDYKPYTVATPLLVLGEVACEMTIPFVTANLIDTIKVGATVEELLPTSGLLVLRHHIPVLRRRRRHHLQPRELRLREEPAPRPLL